MKKSEIMEFSPKNCSIGNISLVKHHTGSVRYLLLLNPDVLVCGSEDRSVSLIDTHTTRLLHSLDIGPVSSLIEISKNTLLITWDNVVSGFFYKDKKLYTTMKYQKKIESHLVIQRAMRLGNMDVVIVCSDSSLKVYRPSTNEILREFNIGSVSRLVGMTTSQDHTDQFFIATVDGKFTVKMVDDSGNVLETFGPHSSRISAISTYRGLEKSLLICGGDSKELYFYDTLSGNLRFKTRVMDDVRSIRFVSKNIFLVGEDFGILEFFHINDEFETKKIMGTKRKHLHNRYIYDTVVYRKKSQDHTAQFFIATCSYDNTVRFITFNHPEIIEEAKPVKIERTGDIELLKKEIEEMKNCFDQRLTFLEAENKSLREENRKLKDLFEEHNEKHHTDKYKFIGVEFDPPLEEYEEAKFKCFKNDSVEMILKFKCIGKENQQIEELGEAKVKLNEADISAAAVWPRSLIFKIQFDKLGVNEIKINFRNIKNHVVPVVVGSTKIEEAKSKIVLCTKEADNVEKFKTGETFEIELHLKNENGAALKFEHLENSLSEVMVKVCVKSKKKKIVGGMVDFEEEVFRYGVLDLGKYKLDADKFKGGKYEIIAISGDGDFKIKKDIFVE